jgi:hypothetical protein
MKILIKSIVLFILLSFLTINAKAQDTTAVIPQMVNYQGYLTDDAGQALNGSYKITFRLYEEPTGVASIRWEEIHNTIDVVNGLFNVLLGSINPLTPEHLEGPRYLEIKVGDEVEMTPRMQLGSAAYALQADKMEPDFDSGWFLVSAATTYPLDLGFVLTDIPMSVQIYYSDNASPQIGADEIWLVQQSQYYYTSAASGMGVYVEIQDASTIKIHTGQSYVIYAYRSGNETSPYPPATASGYYRVRLWK